MCKITPLWAIPESKHPMKPKIYGQNNNFVGGIYSMIIELAIY